MQDLILYKAQHDKILHTWPKSQRTKCHLYNQLIYQPRGNRVKMIDHRVGWRHQHTFDCSQTTRLFTDYSHLFEQLTNDVTRNWINIVIRRYDNLSEFARTLK